MAETPEAGDRYFGIGVAITGFFVGRGARVNPPEALEDLALIDLDAVLYEAFRLPVWIENDAPPPPSARVCWGSGGGRRASPICISRPASAAG